MTLRDRLKAILDKRLKDIYGATQLPSYVIERPREIRYGEYSTNLAMQLAPLVKESPMVIAQKLVDRVRWPAAVGKVLVVAPGFINFYLGEEWLRRQVPTMLEKEYGTSDEGTKKKVLVEFVSANPTGPLHVGNGRGAFIGDVLANVLTATGYKVKREYYINDIGAQTDILAESVTRRFFQAHGLAVPYPDYCYQGAYVYELAKKLDERLNSYKLQDVMKVRDRIKKRVLGIMLADIKKLMDEKMKIHFDTWFSESSLHTGDTVKKLLHQLEDAKLLYGREDALWMRTSQFGDDKDRVLVKSDGVQTYFLSDILYHWNKLTVRKFDKAIDIFGADHHGYIGRLQAAASALGHAGKLDILIVQLVKLVANGQEIKMSKRSGTFVTLDELIDEVGLDVARFFFLMHSAGRHMEFDMTLAKKKSDDNPVYYVQYAHARIQSIIAQAKPLLKDKKHQRATKLSERQSLRLVKKLLEYPDLVSEVAASYDVQRLPFYSMELAETFHDFYHNVRVIEDGVLETKRLELVQATAAVLKKALGLMGIAAPHKM